MRPDKAGKWWWRLESALWVTAIVLLGVSGYRIAKYLAFQNCPQCFAGPSPHSRAPGSSQSATVPVGQESSPGKQRIEVAGRLSVPRLRMNVVVLDGDDDETLAIAPGHIPGTARPGNPGNSVIAGHRDMAFRALRNIQLGDRVQFSGRGSYSYVVSKISIVRPDDISVLQSSSSSMLTLITCYPFRFIGDAPKRFIVQATLVKGS